MESEQEAVRDSARRSDIWWLTYSLLKGFTNKMNGALSTSWMIFFATIYFALDKSSLVELFIRLQFIGLVSLIFLAPRPRQISDKHRMPKLWKEMPPRVIVEKNQGKWYSSRSKTARMAISIRILVR
jgi:hypothetical protein